MTLPRLPAGAPIVALLVLVGSLIIGVEASGQEIHLTPIETLGQEIIRDTTLSNPSGMGCVELPQPGHGFHRTRLGDQPDERPDAGGRARPFRQEEAADLRLLRIQPRGDQL